MKKVFFGLIATALLSSCSTTRNTATLSDIEGEWDITEVKGTKPSVNEGGQQPFIGFDTQNGRVYGYSGCNRIMSSFNRNAKPGVLELKQLAGTMMACPNGHPLSIQNGGHIMGMYILHIKGNNTGFVIQGGITAIKLNIRHSL